MNVVERDLFKQPLSEAEIREFLGDRPASDWFATRSPRFKELGLEGKDLSDAERVAIMAREPYLIRRPSVAEGSKLVAVGMDEKALARIVAT